MLYYDYIVRNRKILFYNRMRSNKRSFILIILAFLVLISFGLLVWKNIFLRDNSLPNLENQITQTPTAINLSAEQTVAAFYQWYLNYNDNPILSEAYKDSQMLSDRLKDSISLQFSQEQLDAVDPLLLAKDKPNNFEIIESVVENNLASVLVSFTFDQAEIFRQITLIKTDGLWQIDQVQIVENNQLVINDDQEMNVNVYFNDMSKYGEDIIRCEEVYGFARSIAATNNLETKIASTLNELFKGPTESEKEVGASSAFNKNTAQLLNKVKIIDNTAYVDLNNATVVLEGNNSSCAEGALIAQIIETVKDNQEIQMVVISDNGSAKAFYEWLQLACYEENNYCQTVFEKE